MAVILGGFGINLAPLLESQADASSPLNGRDLVRKKVSLFPVMAGIFREAQSEGKAVPPGRPECNLMVDVSPAQKVCSSWPTPIVDSGLEIGLATLYPA